MHILLLKYTGHPGCSVPPYWWCLLAWGACFSWPVSLCASSTSLVDTGPSATAWYLLLVGIVLPPYSNVEIITDRTHSKGRSS